MALSQFLWATSSEIYHKVSGWHDQKEADDLFYLRWLRWQTYLVGVGIDPKKAKSPQALFFLPDEGDGIQYTGKPMTQEEYEAKLKRFEEESHVFERWDQQMAERYADTIGT